MKRVQILSIKKNEIIIKRPKKFKVSLLLVSIVIILASIIALSYESISSIASSMVYVYNPVNSLYNDTSNLLFTNGYVIEKDTLDFIIPIKSSLIEVENDGSIAFSVVNSIMVMSPEAGVIEEVGISNDGVKFVKIRHSLEIQTLIQNVDIIGVSKGEIVKKGQDIATAKEGEVIRMQILENNIPLTQLKINQSKIIWKN